MSKVNILHLTHTDLRYDNRILKELEALSEIDNFRIMALGVLLKENATYAERKISASLFNFNLFSNRLKFLPRPISYFCLLIEITFRSFFYSFKSKPDIIHCHDTMVLPVGVIMKLFFKSKLIYDAHELESNKNGQSIALSKVTLFLERICWSKIDHLISVSESIINWYQKIIGFKQSTLILNSPIISNNCQTDFNGYFHNKYNIPFEKLVFVYLGYLGKGRSIETIIDVFTNSSVDSHIIFVGYGELEYEISSYVKKCKKIHLHDAIAHDKIVQIVKSADVGFCLIENISLSDYYCLPNKFFEYIFAGVPVISSNFPELVSMIDKYKLGIYCDLNESSIFNAVKFLESKPPGKIKDKLSEISWHAQTQKLKMAYQLLIKK